MRRFLLERLSDETGVSGAGFVAEGVEFTTGMVALTWRRSPLGPMTSDWSSVAIYPSIFAVEKVHGHDGKTLIRWLEELGDVQHALWCDSIRYGSGAVMCSCDLRRSERLAEVRGEGKGAE